MNFDEYCVQLINISYYYTMFLYEILTDFVDN